MRMLTVDCVLMLKWSPMENFLLVLFGWVVLGALAYGAWYVLGQMAKNLGTGRLQVLGGLFLVGKLF